MGERGERFVYAVCIRLMGRETRKTNIYKICKIFFSRTKNLIFFVLCLFSPLAPGDAALSNPANFRNGRAEEL